VPEKLLAEHCSWLSQNLIEKAVQLMLLGITACGLSLPSFGIAAGRQNRAT